MRHGPHASSRPSWWPLLLRILVVILMAPISASAALPQLARAAAGPAAHVCSCRAGAHDPTCRVCNPHPNLDDDDAPTTAQLRGHCGTDDVAFGASLPDAVVPAIPSVAIAHSVRLDAPRALVTRLDDLRVPPPTPPPESLSA